MKLAIWILWPSFLVGALANALFFTLFDPAEMHSYWELLPPSRLAAYTTGFFAFWAVCTCSSALTCFIQRSADRGNRLSCPLPDHERPSGCRPRIRKS
jgi:hypothetical protein